MVKPTLFLLLSTLPGVLFAQKEKSPPKAPAPKVEARRVGVGGDLKLPISDPGLPLPNSDQRPTFGKEVPRRILVIYGWTDPDRQEIWPMDTLTARRLQQPLEYLGYECDYHHLAKGVPPALGRDLFAGVIFDPLLEAPHSVEPELAHWTLQQFQEGRKVLFFGAMPFRISLEAGRIGKAFGIEGLDAGAFEPVSVKVAIQHETILNYEAKVTPRKAGFEYLEAPTEAEVLLRIEGTNAKGTKRNFDPVFVAPWGGVFVGDYVTFAASPEDQFSYVDPFAFLEKIWPGNAFPIPDTSTRMGLRVFFSHIDGDGFETPSTLNEGALCAEEIRDQILKKYPFPVTVSVIEAASRAVQIGLDPKNRERYESLAKQIFALPNVQPGSHAYSHPFVWIENDPDSEGGYDRPNLELLPDENYPKILPDREVAGSLRYIEKTLLGGKKPEMMLWSGNCRAGAAALASAREYGVECINGGDTIICRKHPAIAGVAPRGIPWGTEFQVFAANQNEYPYARGWEGPFYGGFSKVIETFEMTEKPRRLKPVNIYYHFYSGRSGDSLAALKKAYSWAEEQALHSLTASTYVKTVKDARTTRIFKQSENTWIILSGGQNTTLRVPSDFGLPDLVASQGVLGHKRAEKWTYVATNGQPLVKLVLSPHPPAHLSLTSSSARIHFEEFKARSAKFLAFDYRPVELVFGGMGEDEYLEYRSGSEEWRKATKEQESYKLIIGDGKSAVSGEVRLVSGK